MESGITVDTVVANGAGGTASLAIETEDGEDGQEADDDDWGAFGDGDATPSSAPPTTDIADGAAVAVSDKPQEAEGEGSNK